MQEIQPKDLSNAATMATQEKPAGNSPPTSQTRILKNMIVVCLAFFFLYLPFQSLANLQSSMNIGNNVGVISQTIIYATFILSALFLPKLIIKRFGCKNAIAVCILSYIPYFAANFYPTLATFIPTAMLLGLGGGPLWSAKCTYINDASVLYAAHVLDSEDVITSRFFGIFFMVFQNTNVWGNLLSFYVLKPVEGEEVEESLFNATDDFWATNHGGNFSCGAAYCGGMNENLQPPSEDKIVLLMGLFMCSAVLAALIVFFFLDPIPQKKSAPEDDGVWSRAAATLKHLQNTDQILLVPLTIFNGIEQAFILGVFSKAFVACAWGVHNVSLVFICYGIVNASMSFMSGRLVKYMPRAILMITGAIGNLGVCTVLLLWTPVSDEYIYFFVLVGVWGMSDAIWLTQIIAFYSVLFRANEEAAFANFKLWESVGFSMAFCYSIFLCVDQTIYTLLTFLIVGLVGYLTVEARRLARNKEYSLPKKSKPEESNQISQS